MTPAAVGQQIRNLETYLGIPLLDRHPTGSTPTPHALKVQGALTQHMSGLGDVVADLKAQRDSDRISISVLPSFAENWFPRHLSSLFSAVPGIDLRLDASFKVADLFSGEYDFVVRHSGEPPQDYAYELLLEDYCAPFCTPDFARRYDLSPQCTSLDNVPVADIDVAAFGSTAQLPDLIDWCRRFSIASPTAETGQVIVDYATCMRMARSGLAIVLGGFYEVIDDLMSEKLVMPFGKERVIRIEHSFWLIWRKDRRLSATQKKFLNWITTHAAEDRQRIKGILGL